MTIQSIHLQDFMIIEKADLDFSEGFNVLLGLNGQGKSAVFSAIAYCLSGYRRGASWDSYVRNGQNSFFISLTLKMSSSPRDLMFLEFSGDIPSKTTSKKVTYKGTSYLNSDANTFIESTFDQGMVKNVILSLQDTAGIATLSPAELRDIFKVVFNSDFTDISEKIKTDIEVLKLEESSLKSFIESLNTKAYGYHTITEVDDSQLPILQQELLGAQSVQLERDKYQYYLQKVSDLNSLKRKLISLEDESTKAVVGKEEYALKLTKLDKEKEEAETSFEDIKLKITNHELLRKRTFETADVLRKQVGNLTDLTLEPKHKSALVLDKKNKTLSDLYVVEKYIEAHTKGLCQTCGQKTDANHLPELTSQQKVFNDALKGFESDIKNIDAGIQKITSEYTLRDSEARIAEDAVREIGLKLSHLSGDLSQVQDQITFIDKQSFLYKEESSKQETRIDNCIKAVKDQRASILELSEWCLSNRMDEPVSGLRIVSSIQKDIDAIHNALQAVILSKKWNMELDLQKEADTKLAGTKGIELNTLQIRIKDMVSAKKIIDSDFPNYINSRACIQLEDSINRFFEYVKKGFKIKIALDKKGVVLTYKANNEPSWMPITMVSGFESALVSIGFKVAVANAFGSEILILDEPDGPADETSSELLFNQLSAIKGFKQVFVITHKPSAMDKLKESGATVWSVEAGKFSIV